MEDTSGGMRDDPQFYPDLIVNTDYQGTKGRLCTEQENVLVGLTGPGKYKLVNTLVDKIVDTRSDCEYDNTNQVQDTQDQHVETTVSNQENKAPCVDVMTQEKTTSNSGLKVLIMAPLLALASTQLKSTHLPTCALSEEAQAQEYDKILDIQGPDSRDAFSPGITTEPEEEVITTWNTKKKRIAEKTWVDLSKYFSNRRLDEVLSMENADTDTNNSADVILSKLPTHSFLQRSRFVESSYYVPKLEHSFESEEQLNDMMVYLREKMFDQCDLLQTDKRQENSQKTFPSESDHKDSQEEPLAGVHGSNTLWKQRGKEEFCKRVKKHSPWQELADKGRRMEEFGIKSSVSSYDSYKIAVLL